MEEGEGGKGKLNAEGIEVEVKGGESCKGVRASAAPLSSPLPSRREHRPPIPFEVKGKI